MHHVVEPVLAVVATDAFNHHPGSSISISSNSSSSGISSLVLSSDDSSSSAPSEVSSAASSPYLFPADYASTKTERRAGSSSSGCRDECRERVRSSSSPIENGDVCGKGKARAIPDLISPIAHLHLNCATSRRRALQRHAADIVRREAKALLDLAARLEPEDVAKHNDIDELDDYHANSPSYAFSHALDMLNSMDKHGKVVVAGIGKSGLLARKAVATLNSLGTQAVFLHPVEALHGDLGVVSPHGVDVVILISYSGRTHELVTLASLLRQRKVHGMIAITAPGSPVSLACDVTLDASIEMHEEADNAVPAPTSSVMVALALLDSLALSLLRIRAGWHDQEAERRLAFALNHPGGSLGQQLATA
ncbi:hypothetical protein EMMF5_001015 [Cystobasidiomycetes sp. EMM_F5]